MLNITISRNVPLDFKALGPPDDVSACVDIAVDGTSAGQVPILPTWLIPILLTI